MQVQLALLAFVGYALSALAYLGLTLLIVAGWRRRPQGRGLVVAALLTTLWSAVTALSASAQTLSGFSLLSEIARNGAWLALLLHILRLRLSHDAALPAPLRLIRILAAALVIGLLLIQFIPTPATWLLKVGLVLLAVLGIVLVEQVYRSTRSEERWAIKFLCLGLGSLFIFDFYLYVNLALFDALDAKVWSARGYVTALIAPFIAVSAARNPEWASPVGLSRNMAFHTASLLGAGVYLLLVAGAGYYLKLFGGEWGEVLLTVLVAAAVLFGLLFLLSGTLRARLRVFLSKHFFSYRYDYREEWLKFTRTLSEGRPGEPLCERAVEAVAGLVESPGGALWLKDDNGRFVRNCHWNWAGIEGSEMASSPFLGWLANKQWVLDKDEMQTRGELYAGLTLPPWLAAADDAWLVVPLFMHDDMLGFIVLKHSIGRVSFNWEVSDLLKVAARQAAAHLAQMCASNQLMVARQFESFNRTTTFVIHDLKNLIAQLSLLLANAEKHHHNPEFQADMLDTVENAVTRMNKVLAQLRRGSDSASTQSVLLADVLTDAAASKQAFKLRPQINLPADALRVRADRERLTRAIGHLLQNALEATPPEGQVRLTARESDGHALITVEDTGAGMDENFIRHRLFQPFDSTKGAGMGIGAYECRETIRQLGGQLDVTSTPGQGTQFRVCLPLDSHTAATGAAP